MRLLSCVEVGKILFGIEKNLSEQAYRKRAIRLIYSENLPMKKIAGKWLISVRRFNYWLDQREI